MGGIPLLAAALTDIMLEHIGTIVAVLSLMLSFVVAGAGAFLKYALSQMEIRLRDAIDKSGREIDERIDIQRREFGESHLALRQKIHEIEVWARDTFVRRDSFYKVSDDLTNSIITLGNKIDTRLERMEEKIDSKT